MIIKNLTLNNFRQFKDIQKVTFSQDIDKNITLILGDNTSGKTTLLQAFLWVLYGEAHFKTRESLLNSKVAEEVLEDGRDRKVEISLEIEHQGTPYFIVRTLNHYLSNGSVRFNKSTLSVSYIAENGESETIPTYEAQKKITEILPENLSPYFLYDTERFDAVSTKNDVTNSVKSILGLKFLENIIDHIGTRTRSKSVLGKLSNSLELEGDSIAQEAFEKMNEISQDIAKAKAELAQKEKELGNYDRLIKDKEDILRQLEETATYQKEKDDIAQKLEKTQSELQRNQTEFQRIFKKDLYKYTGRALFREIENQLHDTQLDKRSIRDMNANAIEDIIERGVCVCGTEVHIGNEAHEHLLEEMRYLPPESIGTLLKYFKEKVKESYEQSEDYFVAIENSYKNVLKCQDDQAGFEDEIDALNEKLAKSEDVDKHHSQLVEFEHKKRAIMDRIAVINQNLGVLEKAFRDNEEKYKKHIAITDKNQEINTYLAYAENVLEWVKSQYGRREKDIKIQLEEKVNHYFQRMYHGKRKVEITEKYEVKLITTDLHEEIETDESQGLGTVKNFAFIAGLVELAKEKLTPKEQLDTLIKDSEEYPLILDAPFSNADDKHVERISSVLPNVANQLILIVMSKDWNYAEKSLSPKVGKKYILDKQTEVHTVIKEVD